jgi:hypothetical protein
LTEEHPYRPAPGAPRDEVEPLWDERYDAPEQAADYDRLASEAERGTLRFDRKFRNRVFVVDGGWVSLTDMDDDFHSMRVALRIEQDGVISTAAGRMIRNPYETCPRALESLRALQGANIARPSAHRQIKDRIARTEGCLHVVDMLTVAFRAFRISKGHDIQPDYGGEGTRRMLLNLLPNMRDTCLSFAVEHPERA